MFRLDKYLDATNRRNIENILLADGDHCKLSCAFIYLISPDLIPWHF